VWDGISSFGDNLKINKINYMFGIFKKKTEIEKLEIKYKALLKEAYDLSKTNRSKSDQKTFGAEEVYKQIEILKEKK
jgi:hypothetical protein|tara:strand:- start:14 stop:244 length:231 start_codon:yes stop_codon:yes gene_type:complete